MVRIGATAPGVTMCEPCGQAKCYSQRHWLGSANGGPPNLYEEKKRMHDWVTLTTVFGRSVTSPSEQDMRKALKELFSSADDEHPDAWIECGTEDGPLYSISVFSGGHAIYTKYSDADMTLELETKKIENVDMNIALDLWRNLASGG